MSIYDFTVKRIDGTEESLSKYQGEVLLIVNTATECGFTPQLDELQALYDSKKMHGFQVLGFPSNEFGKQNPDSNEATLAFCQRNYGVEFPMFETVQVNGKNAHPLFKHLKKEAGGLTEKIKWNFTKFLVDRKGNVIKRFAPITKPEKIAPYIAKEISK